MKISVSVDVDWIEEDGNIDEELKQELILGIKNAIASKCLADIEKKASSRIDEAVEAAITKAEDGIEKRALTFFDEWLTNEVTITDRWGDKKQEVSLETFIKNTLEHIFNNDRVNTRTGQITRENYNSVPLLDYINRDKIKKVVEEKLKNLASDIDKKIDKQVNQTIKDNVSNKVAEILLEKTK